MHRNGTLRGTLLLLAGPLSACMLQAQDGPALLPLQGTWEGTVDGERYVEQWTCAADVCNGSATSYSGDVAVMQETTRIMQFAGRWHYLVWLGDGPAVAFTRTFANDTTWVFENKAHDFPQRISYTVRGDTLSAFIAGPTYQGAVQVDFTLRRVK